jgi:hypothetical protein
MFETLSDRRKRIDQLFDETKWRYIWLLFGAGVLLYLALFILCFRLWLLLRSCHCVA